MLVNMQKKSLVLNKCSINENISDWIEQDIIVPDSKPDAVKIVNLIRSSVNVSTEFTVFTINAETAAQMISCPSSA